MHDCESPAPVSLMYFDILATYKLEYYYFTVCNDVDNHLLTITYKKAELSQS